MAWSVDDPGSPRLAEATRREPDGSFRLLVGELAWRRLPDAVRERFAWKPLPGAEIRYAGAMRQVRSSALGWVLAQLYRAIGTPLAPWRGQDVPVTVVLHAAQGDGIEWRRLYRFPGKPELCCSSVKRVDRDGGLIECVGAGIGMWLSLSVEERALHFRSTAYFWALGSWRLALPLWLTPGLLHVIHADLGGGRFRFVIAVDHPWFGETFYQDGIFAAERS
jgi:hypothetical protein